MPLFIRFYTIACKCRYDKTSIFINWPLARILINCLVREHGMGEFLHSKTLVIVKQEAHTIRFLGLKPGRVKHGVDACNSQEGIFLLGEKA